jgi:hypothetical protein
LPGLKFPKNFCLQGRRNFTSTKPKVYLRKGRAANRAVETVPGQIN